MCTDFYLSLVYPSPYTSDTRSACSFRTVCLLAETDINLAVDHSLVLLRVLVIEGHLSSPSAPLYEPRTTVLLVKSTAV